MRSIELGTSGQEVPNIIAGMMRIGDKTDVQIRDLYAAARESSVNYFDHADLYCFNVPEGEYHVCERSFAVELELSSAERDDSIVQSKTGIIDNPWGYDQSYEHIVASAERSLKALNMDYLDVLLLHRPDALVEPEEV